MPSTLQNLIASMLVENTGVHMMDSGGENGRKWQRNQGKIALRSDGVYITQKK